MAECRYRGMCCMERDAGFDAYYPCDGDGSGTCMWYQTMPNVHALLGVADELHNLAFRMSLGDAGIRPRDMYGYAGSIFDALEGK